MRGLTSMLSTEEEEEEEGKEEEQGEQHEEETWKQCRAGIRKKCGSERGHLLQGFDVYAAHSCTYIL